MYNISYTCYMYVHVTHAHYMCIIQGLSASVVCVVVMGLVLGQVMVISTTGILL